MSNAPTATKVGAGAGPVLEFAGVSLPPMWPYDSGVVGQDLVLQAGDLVLVLLPSPSARPPLADLAQGLVTPSAGAVRFLGRDWAEVAVPAAIARRGQMGRIFAGTAWVSNLNVDENVLLAAGHQEAPALAAASERAAALATRFGLLELPTTRPALTSDMVLQLAQWVRALLGEPRLLVLEQPLRAVPAELVPPLVTALGEARRAGAAVLWLAGDEDEARLPGLAASAVYHWRDAALESVTPAPAPPPTTPRE